MAEPPASILPELSILIDVNWAAAPINPKEIPVEEKVVSNAPGPPAALAGVIWGTLDIENPTNEKMIRTLANLYFNFRSASSTLRNLNFSHTQFPSNDSSFLAC